jgi:hypothetical protein
MNTCQQLLLLVLLAPLYAMHVVLPKLIYAVPIKMVDHHGHHTTTYLQHPELFVLPTILLQAATFGAFNLLRACLSDKRKVLWSLPFSALVWPACYALLENYTFIWGVASLTPDFVFAMGSLTVPLVYYTSGTRRHFSLWQVLLMLLIVGGTSYAC